MEVKTTRNEKVVQSTNFSSYQAFRKTKEESKQLIPITAISNKTPRKKHVHGDLVFPQKNKKEGKQQYSAYDFIQIIKNDPELKDDFWYCNRKGDAYDFEFVKFKHK